VQLEIPRSNGASWLRTLEGIFDNVIEDLGSNQPLRKIEDPEGFEKIDNYLKLLED